MFSFNNPTIALNVSHNLNDSPNGIKHRKK